jgi:ferrous-iron efflux pump FieF
MTLNNSLLMRLATYASVIVALMIIIAKIIAWLMTDSLSLMASLIDSTLDVLASLVNLFAIYYALKPADDDHRFGHGKAKDIAAFAQSAFITGSAIFIGAEAINRIISPREIMHSDIGIMAMSFSIVMILGLVIFQRFVIYRTKSRLVEADSIHYQADLLVNAVVIFSLWLSHYFKLTFIDPVLGLLIAAYILRSAWKVGRKSFDSLMDKELEDSIRESIMEIALSVKDVKGIHDLRTRHSGTTPIIQIHVELDPHLPLYQAHEVSEAVEAAILALLPTSEVLVHLDPATTKMIDIRKNHAMSINP